MRGPGNSTPLLLLAGFLAACSPDANQAPTDPAQEETASSRTGSTLAVRAAVGQARDEAIRGQYIVVFSDAVADPPGLARSLASRHDLRLLHTYRHAIKGFTARFPEEAEDAVLASLRHSPRVRYIEPDRYRSIDVHVARGDSAGGRGFEPALRAVAVGSPAAPPPASPSDLVATAQSSSRIDLEWTDNSQDESVFEIERRLGQSGSFGKIAQVKKNVTNDADTQVSPDTEYCYRVRAVAGKGKNKLYSDYSNVSCATTPVGPPPGEDPPPEEDPPADDRPSNLTATAVGPNTIQVRWTDNKDNESGFELERQKGQLGFTWKTRMGPNIIGYDDATVQASTQYCYRIRAYRTRGRWTDYTEYSNIDCDTTPSPPLPDPPDGAPTDLAATAVSSRRVNLSWSDNSTNEAGFGIERCAGEACSDFEAVVQTGADVTAYSDLGLEASTTYRYRVQAFNAAAGSAYSNEASATTLAAPPPGGCADAGGHDSLADLWGVERVGAHLNPRWQGARNGGDCAMQPFLFVIDTGVDSDHPDLYVVETMSFVGGGSGEDDHGHGSHVAGTAAAIDGNGGVVGVAPGAPIYGVKVCDSTGLCPLSAIIAGIDEVTARKLGNPAQPMVANMSLGGGGSAAEDEAVRGSVNAGVVYTVSAGNGAFGSCIVPDDARFQAPARVGDDDINAADGSDGDTRRINGVITTTSSDQADRDANCNYGPPVTVAAPGVGIRSAWLNGGYATISGTSMAAPHAAGAAILYLQSNPGASPTQVEDAIVNLLDPWTTDDLPNADGRLNVEDL